MRILIDIPEIEYNTRKTMGYFSDNIKILEAVANGTPMPDNATNGEIMQMMFPNAKIEQDGSIIRFIVDGWSFRFADDWWNSPYQEGGKE